MPKQENSAKILLLSAAVISICGLLYELLIASLSVSLKGNPILQYSLAIGVFMSALGIGSFLAQFLKGQLIFTFVLLEGILGLIGGLSITVLNFVYLQFMDVYHLASALTLLSVGVLVGIEIPLLTFIIQDFSSVKKSISNVLTFDYIGGLIASLLFPLFLYPYFGLIKTAFLVGLMNFAVAFLNFFVFLSHFNRQQKLVIYVLNGVGACVLLGGFFFSSALHTFYSNKLFGHVVYDDRSVHQRILLTQRNGNTRLFLDHYLQFSSLHEHRYHEALVYPAFYSHPRARRILLLGGGDGLAAREILKFPSVEKLVLVDMDGKVTQLAQNFSLLRTLNKDSLHNRKVEVVTQDAYEYLLSAHQPFDVIYADFPDPHSPEIAKLYSYEFFMLVAGHLSPQGVFITQASSPYHANAVFWSIYNTLQPVFQRTVPYHVNVPDFGEWGFVLAFKSGDMWPVDWASLSGTFDTIDTRFFSCEVFQASLVFPKDLTAHKPLSINYLTEPVLFTYYLESWQVF